MYIKGSYEDVIKEYERLRENGTLSNPSVNFSIQVDGDFASLIVWGRNNHAVRIKE